MTPLRSLALRALGAGLAAGFLVGAGDTLLSWSALGQFLDTAAGRLTAAAYAGAICASAGGLAAAAVAALWIAVFRATCLGEIAVSAWRRQMERRAEAPARALGPFSLVLTGVPAAAAALILAFQAGLAVILVRHHKGLIVAAIMAITIVALIAAALAAALLGRAFEILLGRILTPRAARLLGHPMAAVIALAILALGAAGLAAFAAWETLVVVGARPLVALLVFAALAAVLARFAPAGRRAAISSIAALILSIALVAILGGSDAARKAVAAHTGLIAHITAAVQTATDFDRDGYSSFFGGGDCAAFDAAVFPGAVDFPDDGVDQNCLGGDSTAFRSVSDLRFATLPAAVPKDASILFLSVDALRADHVGAYGYSRPTTPNIDAVAAAGALFENAFAHAPSTRYSIPAILTGRYPSQVLWDKAMWWPGLMPENDTMAEKLKALGFATGAVLGYSYFEPRRRLNQGFDSYDNAAAVLHQGRDPANTRGTSSKEIADKTIAFLERNAGRRFFLWAHFYDPHQGFERHPGTMEWGDRPVDLYDHEIRFTDEHIGRVLARLDALGLAQRTVVVVTGDHGTGFGEHGIAHHGYHLYAAQTKVPIIFRVPGLGPRRIRMPVGHVDLLPTFVNLAGGESSPTMFGRSLVAVLSGAERGVADREVFQEVIYEGPTERRAVVTSRHHLIYNRVPSNTFELYDRVLDPEEKTDVWREGAVEPLKRDLLSWINVAEFPPEHYAALARTILLTPPRPELPLTADFGGLVRLCGADLGARSVRPGGRIDVTCYLEALAPLDGNVQVVVSFEGRRARFGDTSPPADGVLPIEQWRVGQVIAHRRAIRVPTNAAPGAYDLLIGLRRGWGLLAPTAAGAPSPLVQGKVRLASVDVVP